MNVNHMGPITKRSIELMTTSATGRGGNVLSINQRSALTAAAILMRTSGYPATAHILEGILVRG
jgi:hypothetical protein